MMVVRREGSNKGKLGKKIVKTLAAGMVVVPGVLSNPLLIDQNAMADTVPTVPNLTLYKGQVLELGEYGYETSEYNFRISGYGLNNYDSSNISMLHADEFGTYTVYIYDNEVSYPPVQSFQVTVRDIDMDNNQLIDISDIVKNLALPTVTGVSWGGEHSLQSVLYNVDSFTKVVNSNRAPVVNTIISSSHYLTLFSAITYLGLDCIHVNCTYNSYFTDPDEDYLTYRIVSNSSPSEASFTIVNNQIRAVRKNSSSSPITLTVEAIDKYGATAQRQIMIDNSTYFYNSAPNVLSTYISSSESTMDINLNKYFIDENEDDITYTINTEGMSTGHTATLSSNILSVTELEPTTSEIYIYISATDQWGHFNEPTFFTISLGDEPY